VLPKTTTGVFMASSEACLWARGMEQGQTLLARRPPQCPREACVTVPVPWWVSASPVSQCGGRAERWLSGAGSCHAPPERAHHEWAAAGPCSSWLAVTSEPVGTKFRVES